MAGLPRTIRTHHERAADADKRAVTPLSRRALFALIVETSDDGVNLDALYRALVDGGVRRAGGGIGDAELDGWLHE